MGAVTEYLCVEEKSADNRFVCVSVFEVSAKRYVLSFIAMFDGACQLEIRLLV